MTETTPHNTMTTLRSDDLSCPSCVPEIEKALVALAGVKTAAVRFTTGRILVEHDPEQAPVTALVAAIEKTGYTATPAAY